MRGQLYLLVHCRGVGFICVFVNSGDSHSKSALTEGDFQLISHLHLIAGFDLLAVDGYSGGITGFICHRSPFYNPGNLEIFIKSHNSLPSAAEDFITAPYPPAAIIEKEPPESDS